MTGSGSGKLYTPELLALATTLADRPLRASHAITGEAVSRTCGSKVMIGFDPMPRGRIGGFGMQVSACAVGQAAAAVFAQGAEGCSAADVEEAERAIVAWLGGGALPAWPGIAAIAAAQAHPGRHGAILLPWRAARDALSKVVQSG